MSKPKTKRKTRSKEVLVNKKPVRCAFVEATGNTNCPFHTIDVKIDQMTNMGRVMVYKAKRTKYGIRGQYKRRKNGTRKDM